MAATRPVSHVQQSHLKACWRETNCGACVRSPHGCGWCNQSATCVPASSLLDPVFKPGACPLGQERFELRTKALGCGCSTATLLSVIVTVFGTVLALFLIYAVALCIRATNRTYGTGARQGWEVQISDDGRRVGKPWKRPSWTKTFRKVFHRKSLTQRSEQEEITERLRLLPAN